MRQSLISSAALVGTAQALNYTCTPSAIQAALPQGASVNFAYPVAANATFNVPKSGTGYPTSPPNLPALCAASIQVKSIEQFDNPANIDVHLRTTVPEILADFGDDDRGFDALITGVGTGGHITAAGREKLREAGFAPPTPRAAGATPLVQLQSKAFRCPYCGSSETRLDNIFGPTPCRSVRYCESCRQPFEQFKTI